VRALVRVIDEKKRETIACTREEDRSSYGASSILNYFVHSDPRIGQPTAAYVRKYIILLISRERKREREMRTCGENNDNLCRR